MLQHLNSYVVPVVYNLKQADPVALLSANVEYENEQVTELESLKGVQ